MDTVYWMENILTLQFKCKVRKDLSLCFVIKEITREKAKEVI